MRRSGLQVALAAIAVFGLAGCTTAVGEEGSPSRSVTPETATPSPTALTAVDAERIVEETYNELLDAERTMLASGGSNSEPMYAVTTDNMQDYRDEITQLSGQNVSVHGHLTVTRLQLQSYSSDEIDAIVCIDTSNGHLERRDGTKLGGDRDGKLNSARTKFIRDESVWMIDRKEHWTDSDFC